MQITKINSDPTIKHTPHHKECYQFDRHRSVQPYCATMIRPTFVLLLVLGAVGLFHDVEAAKESDNFFTNIWSAIFSSSESKEDEEEGGHEDRNGTTAAPESDESKIEVLALNQTESTSVGSTENSHRTKRFAKFQVN